MRPSVCATHAASLAASHVTPRVLGSVAISRQRSCSGS
jgi:hypothetical protein